MIGFSENCYFAEVEQFSVGKVSLSNYVNTNTSFLRNTSLKIVTCAKESKFKRMCFRNYCKFSCTSGSEYSFIRMVLFDPGLKHVVGKITDYRQIVFVVSENI
jgi:hypothetical protein